MELYSIDGAAAREDGVWHAASSVRLLYPSVVLLAARRSGRDLERDLTRQSRRTAGFDGNGKMAGNGRGRGPEVLASLLNQLDKSRGGSYKAGWRMQGRGEEIENTRAVLASCLMLLGSSSHETRLDANSSPKK